MSESSGPTSNRRGLSTADAAEAPSRVTRSPPIRYEPITSDEASDTDFVESTTPRYHRNEPPPAGTYGTTPTGHARHGVDADRPRQVR